VVTGIHTSAQDWDVTKRKHRKNEIADDDVRCGVTLF
jgi:hypothetical protein